MAYLLAYDNSRPVEIKKVIEELSKATDYMNGSIVAAMKKLSEINDIESGNFGIDLKKYENSLFRIGAEAPWNYVELLNQFRQCMVIKRTLEIMAKREYGYYNAQIIDMSPSQQQGLDVLGVNSGNKKWGLECYGGVNVKNNYKALSDAENLYLNTEIETRLFSCYASAWDKASYKVKPEGFFELYKKEYGRYYFLQLFTSLSLITLFQVSELEKPVKT